LSSSVLNSSAQNQFSGVVTSVAAFRHGVRVDIDCGFVLSALVTERAIDQLQIRIGSDLSASFKASAVRLY
ncbi:MAG: TOBE domain-containing protein, partial [Spirochaetota bacterium]